MPLGLKVCGSAPQHPPPSVRQLRGGTVYTISRSFLMELSSIWPLWNLLGNAAFLPFVLAKPTSYLVFLGMASKVPLSIPLSRDIPWNPNHVSAIHSKHPSLYGQCRISVLRSILSGLEDTHEGLAKGSAPVTLDRRGNFSDVSHARSRSGDGRNGPALLYPALTNALHYTLFILGPPFNSFLS